LIFLTKKEEKTTTTTNQKRLVPSKHKVLASIVITVFAIGMVFSLLGIVPVVANGVSSTGAAALPSNLRIGPVQGVSSVPTQHASPGLVKETSSNWAGYAVVPSANGEIDEVTAEWYVPTTSCSEPTGSAEAVQWIGIDGWGSGTVEQDGTLEYCSSPGATPQYYLWWEFYPYNSIQICSTCSGVAPGQFVQAYVMYNPGAEVNGKVGVYTLTITDLSNYAITVTVTGNPSTCNSGGACEGGPNHSVECIAEDPGTGSGSLWTLANYGSVKFYACEASINGKYTGIGSFGKTVTTYELTQTGPISGSDIQIPSALSTYLYGKSEFSVTWNGYS
jgi:hypothetical protein